MLDEASDAHDGATSESDESNTASEEDGARRSNLLVPDVEPWPSDSDEPIIELEDVHKSFDDETIFEGLSLSIVPGEITVVIGNSGSGKSVLIKHMNGLMIPDRGEVRLFGESTREMSGRKLDRARKRIGTLFQSYALFDSMNVVDNVAFPLVENGAMSRREAREQATKLLETLGLGHALEQYPATLSGGMKKRVSLARALVTHPEVVLFDEPTTGLDPIMMEFVDDMIEEATEDFQLTSFLISHDMASVFRLADSIAVLHGGEIVAHDTPEAIRESDDERVRSLLRGSRKDDIQIEGAADDDLLVEGTEYAVEVDDVHKTFGGDTEVLTGATMHVPKHKITVLIGGSGEGKSVLMKHLLGLHEPTSGTVRVFGRDLAQLDESELRQLRTQIGMLFQHAALFDSMSVESNVAFPLVERQAADPEEIQDRVDRVLEKLHIDDIRDQMPIDISSGQQKRVSLARALITEPELVIYDEPTTGQDPTMSKEVEEMILEVQSKFDVTSLVISHDMGLTSRIADHVAMLHSGAIIAEGSPAALLNSEDERVQTFIFASEVGAQM